MLRILGLAALLAAAPALSAAQDKPRPVKTMTVARADAIQTRQFFGKVVARQTVDLAFQVGGQIVTFPVLEGHDLAAGDLIAELDREPFELALDRAVVQKKQAERALDRVRALSSSAVSTATVEDAESSAELAELAVRDAEYALEHATLHAPFDGIVAAREVANYTTVSAGAPVVRLHDVSEWRVEIDVPEILFRRAGAEADLDLAARFPGERREIPLEIREFNAEASRIGQTFRLTLAMLEPPGPGVLPGSSVSVRAALREPDGPVVLPAAAVAIAADGATSVLVFEPEDDGIGTLRRRAISLTTGPDGEFLVEDGLAPGTEIVAAGADALEDGMAVRRFAGFAN